MSDFDFLVSICTGILNPLPPMTEEEKDEVLRYEWEMEQMSKEEDWPPYDIALEL